MASYVKSFFKNLVNTPQNPAERLAEIWRNIQDAHSEMVKHRYDILVLETRKKKTTTSDLANTRTHTNQTSTPTDVWTKREFSKQARYLIISERY